MHLLCVCVWVYLCIGVEAVPNDAKSTVPPTGTGKHTNPSPRQDRTTAETPRVVGVDQRLQGHQGHFLGYLPAVTVGHPGSPNNTQAGERFIQKRFGSRIQELRKFMEGWEQRRGRSSFRPRNQERTWLRGLVNRISANIRQTRKKRQIFGYQRKEYRQLTKTERQRFHTALQAMMSTSIPGSPLTQYHFLVSLHQNPPSPAAHGGPAFLPWHRIFLLIFDFILKSHDLSTELPYWDSTLDRDLPNARDSIMFSHRFLGTSSGTVTTGPFAFLPVIASCTGIGATLTRGFSTVQTWLYDDGAIAWFNSFNSYPGLVSSGFEAVHGGPHMYVGGHMASITCSPSDPIFWMHHAFIDYLWEDFRNNHQTTSLGTDYPWPGPPPAHAPFSVMEPFAPLRNIFGLNPILTAIFYTYNGRQINCVSDANCQIYLWCDSGRCRSKVRVGGNAAGYPVGSTSPCECGEVTPAAICAIMNITQWIACLSV